MLKECAPDHNVKEYTHSYCIMFKGKTFPTLPKKHQQVDRGIVKKMAKHLEMLDCAARHLPL